MLARVVLVLGGDALLRISHVRIPTKWQKVLIYGGLRGGICVALVLSLPTDYEYKALFVTLVFSLILVNLLVNPILLSRYLRKSKLNVDATTDGNS
jgi:CPA1 family monovalent cation:H+ antiporter